MKIYNVKKPFRARCASCNKNKIIKTVDLENEDFVVLTVQDHLKVVNNKRWRRENKGRFVFYCKECTVANLI